MHPFRTFKSKLHVAGECWSCVTVARDRHALICFAATMTWEPPRIIPGTAGAGLFAVWSCSLVLFQKISQNHNLIDPLGFEEAIYNLFIGT